MTDDPIVIIGGGLAGLSAAMRLATAGLQPLLLEAAPRLGGRVAASDDDRLEHDGREWIFRAEHGIHGIWGQYRNLRALLAELNLLDTLVPAQREDWLHAEGDQVRRAEAGSAVRRSWFPAPLHYLALLLRPRFLSMLGARDLIGLPRVIGSLYLALAYDPLCEPTRLDRRNLETLFHHWPPRLRAFVVALLRSGLADQPGLVPLSGAVAFLRFYTLLRRDAWEFAYLPADPGRALLEPLAAAIQQRGGRIQCDTPVTALTRATTGWHVQTARGAFSCRQVIVALDAPNARQLFNASPEIVGEGLEWPAGLATGVARFWFSRAPRAGAESGICSGDFTIDNFFWLQRFQRDVAAWHTASGGALVEAHIYGPPEVLALADEVLLERARGDLLRAYPELRDSLIHQAIRRNPATHTRFAAGYGGRHLGVASPWPGISCAGDWIAYPHPALFLERACVTGIAAAARAAAALRVVVPPPLPPAQAEPLARALETALRGVRELVRR